MKKVFLLLQIYAGLVFSQNTTVNYTSSNIGLANPDRGFYKFTTTSPNTYELLNQTTLANYRLNSKITLIYREFSLANYKTSSIPQSYLTNMQTDFNRIRNAGLKAIIRFTYSNSESATVKDASKTMILAHLQQLQPLLTANVDVISLMQAGFIGAWGEWYYTSQSEFGGYGYNNTALTTSNIANRKAVIDEMLAALPSSRMVQIRTPTFKRSMYSTTALPESVAFNKTSIARLGHFNDCFLASPDDFGTFENTATEYPYLIQETKYLAMGGETCAVNSPRSDCASALLEMSKFHWSYLNLDYYPAVIAGFTEDNCFNEIQKKLGYHFELTSAVLPQAVALGSSLNISLSLKNQGFAAPFNERKAYLVLKHVTTNQTYSILLNSDPRKWLGPTIITINQNLVLPTNLTAGNYKLYLSLPDSEPSLANRPEYAIQMGNTNVWESATGLNSLNHTINVSATSLAIANNTKFNLSIYPVPSSDELTVELDEIKDYSITIVDILGQKILLSKTLESNKMTLNTEGLNDGMYFISFFKNGVLDTRKFVIKR
jgi:Domain of unknown function (DUF4832)/Domain of unknown function (DUF4874)/Secretion system C-terminal sorting domain